MDAAAWYRRTLDSMEPFWRTIVAQSPDASLIEDDGVMAMLGWLFTALTAVWTVFLVIIGHAAVMAALAAFRNLLFS